MSHICPYLQIHDDGLHQQEDNGVILPADVCGRFTQFNTGNSCAFRQLFASTVTSQGFPQILQKQFLQEKINI